MSDGKRKTDARALEDYLENKQAYKGELAPDVERLVDSLQQWRHEATLQPRAGFTNELSEQLKDERSEAHRPWTVWPALSRVLASAAAIAALFLFAFFVTGLFRQPVGPVTMGEGGTPATPETLQATGGMFEGVAFRFEDPLSEETQQLPLYVIDAAPLPETPDAAREMALALGMENPRVYEAHGFAEGWIVEDDAGRLLTTNRKHVRFPIIYHAPVSFASDTTVPSFADARSVAVQFLEAAGLLPEGYEAREQLNETGDKLRRVEIIPTLEGRPVHYASSEVAVGPDGTVVEARAQALSFVPSGEVVIAQPAETAFAKVLESGATMDGRRHSELAATVKHFPTFGAEMRGANITVVGYITALQRADGRGLSRDTLIRLLQHPEGVKAFELTGLGSSGLQAAYFVEVTGTLAAPRPGGGWEMVVNAWRELDAENVIECADGVLQAEGPNITFETSEGLTFALAYPPDAPGGERAIVCAAFATATQGMPLPWVSVISPVSDDLMRRVEASGPDGEELEVKGYGDLYDTLTIDWTTPGYVYVYMPTTATNEAPGQLLQPAWLFYGHSPDGSMQFVLRAPAEAARTGE